MFVVTGRCATGDRKAIAAEIIARGGDAVRIVTKKVDYLVIGDVGSRDWIHSTHGHKIEKAIEPRDKGQQIAIISEEHWVTVLA